MANPPRKLNVGNDSVVIGNVTGDIGNGSVVIGATDDSGNTIISTPLAVGRGAFAGPESIAIGAGAGAGVGASLPFLVNQLSDAVAKVNDPQVTARFTELIAGLAGENGTVDKTKALSALGQLRNLATLNGVWGLIDRIIELLG